MSTPTTPPHVPRARLRLVTGSSNVSLRELEGERPRWLRIGSDPDSDWRVHAEGVAPAHCELLWDGHGLFVQDRLRLGGTYAGSQRVTEWTALPKRTVLRMGSAAMWIEAPGDQPREPRAEVLRWVQELAEQRLAERRSGAAETTRSWSTAGGGTKLLSSSWWLASLSWLERIG